MNCSKLRGVLSFPLLFWSCFSLVSLFPAEPAFRPLSSEGASAARPRERHGPLEPAEQTHPTKRGASVWIWRGSFVGATAFHANTHTHTHTDTVKKKQTHFLHGVNKPEPLGRKLCVFPGFEASCRFGAGSTGLFSTAATAAGDTARWPCRVSICEVKLLSAYRLVFGMVFKNSQVVGTFWRSEADIKTS